MTPQEIFNTVAKHLFAQGKRSRSEIGDNLDICVYRAPDGSKCAVGVLIPDACYDPQFEGNNVIALLNQFNDVLPRWMDANMSLLSALQDVHDTPENWCSEDRLKDAFRRCADYYSLDSSILAELSFPASKETV